MSNINTNAEGKIRVEFSPNIRKHIAIEPCEINGQTVREVLESVFESVPELRGYVLDDQGAVRQHVTVFVNDDTIRDREQLTDPLAANDRVYVFQALSGG